MTGDGAAWQVETPGDVLGGHPVVAAQPTIMSTQGAGSLWRPGAAPSCGSADTCQASARMNNVLRSHT